MHPGGTARGRQGGRWRSLTPDSTHSALAVPECRFARRLLRKSVGASLACGDEGRDLTGCLLRRGAGAVPQAVAGVRLCRQSLRRLCAAFVSRHSDRAADLPRRKKRSMRRLNLVSAKIGSIIVWRLAYSSPPASVARTLRMNA